MLKSFCTLLLCLQTLCTASQIHLRVEQAETEAKKKWGLMQRRSLPKDYGMLFSYSTPARPSIWSFNCLLDLCVLFLNRDGVVQEIAILKAYPEVMDPNRPVNNLQDMRKYPASDPITQFFQKHSLSPHKPCWHILEISLDCYHTHKIKVGDTIIAR